MQVQNLNCTQNKYAENNNNNKSNNNKCHDNEWSQQKGEREEKDTIRNGINYERRRAGEKGPRVND